jgi:hypothetical protein
MLKSSPILNEFFFPIKFQLLNFLAISSSTIVSTLILQIINLFTTLKLRCTQIAHSFKKQLLKQKCFHVSNERETQNKLTSKKSP